MKTTPFQLANALLTVVPDLRQAQKSQREMNAIRDMMNEACEDTYQRAPFWGESAAHHLLYIIKSFGYIDLSGPAAGLGGYQAQWLELALETAAGGRFYREKQDENERLSLDLLDKITKIPAFVFTDAFADGNVYFPSTLFLHRHHSTSLHLQRLLKPNPISLLTATLRQLRARLPEINRLIRSAVSKRPQGINAGALLFLDSLIEGRDWSELSLTIGGAYMTPWKSCELLRDGRIDAVEAGTVQCGEGLEMAFCGRCKAVRYCCREHQRDHWKRHKLLCFKPTW